MDESTAYELLAATAIGRFLTFGSCQVEGLEDVGLDVTEFRRAVRSVAHQAGVSVRTRAMDALVLVHNDNDERTELAKLVSAIYDRVVVKATDSGGLVLDPKLARILDVRTAFLEHDAPDEPRMRHHLRVLPDDPS